ncbi:hypothetical protein ACFQ08_19700, partial [Streptosporangium algeriense]
TTEPVRLSLTGGRDSRLLAALLYKAGIPFVTATSGHDDGPDVVLAKQVAQALGVRHSVARPKRSDDGTELVVPHPHVRGHNVLFACEGMISAYENIPVGVRFDPTPRMSGHGGEILRGGFLHNQVDLDDRAVRRRIDGLFGRNADLLTDQGRQHAQALASPWRDMCRQDGPGALDRLYLAHRVGRWHAASRASLLRGQNPVPPFLDNLVVRTALGVDPLWRRSEALIHGVINAFAPALRDVPIEGRPWRFTEERHPGLWDRLRSRGLRAVMSAGSVSAGLLRSPAKFVQAPAEFSKAPAERFRKVPAEKPWNWRTKPSAELIGLLRAAVLDERGELRADGLARVVDAAEVARLPDSRMDVLWHLYTVSTMLTDAFATPDSPALPSVRVPIPR